MKNEIISPIEASSTVRRVVSGIRIAELMLGFRMRSSGLENIPPETPVILALSHHTSVDIFASGYAIQRCLNRPVNYMAYDQLLDGTDPKLIARFGAERARKMGKLLVNMHALPVNRDGMVNREQIRGGLNVLEQGGLLGLFDEGRIVEGNTIGELKGLVQFMASKSGALVVPVGIAANNYGQRGSALAYLPRSAHVHAGLGFYADGIGRGKEAAEHFSELLRPAMQDTYDIARAEYNRSHWIGLRPSSS